MNKIQHKHSRVNSSHIKYIFYSMMLFFFLVISCLLASTSALSKLTELYKWSSLDYTFASDAHKSYALERGEFVPENNLPVGIEVWKNKLFVTVPRWSNGNVQ